MTLDARLIVGRFVAPYRMTGKGGKGGKTDANNAAGVASQLQGER